MQKVDSKKTLTTTSGRPVGDNQNSVSAGARGFAVKCYTEEGNWDRVGNNTLTFFPQTHLKSPAMMWDFWSLSPESMHQVTILYSDRGTPRGYRHMNGYSSHTYSLVNVVPGMGDSRARCEGAPDRQFGGQFGQRFGGDSAPADRTFPPGGRGVWLAIGGRAGGLRREGVGGGQ